MSHIRKLLAFELLVCGVGQPAWHYGMLSWYYLADFFFFIEVVCVCVCCLCDVVL